MHSKETEKNLQTIRVKKLNKISVNINPENSSCYSMMLRQVYWHARIIHKVTFFDRHCQLGNCSCTWGFTQRWL